MNDLRKYEDHALLLLRWAFGFRLIYGVQDNILSWERMIEFANFLEANGFPLPLFSAVVSVYAQGLAGLSWVVGFRVKWAAGLMIGNFLVALIMVHVGEPYLGGAAAIHMLVISIFLLVRGGGKFSFD